jgi:predicted secreted protein
MTWVSIIAIYLLFWVMTVFVVLPFGIKNHEETGIEKVAGQDHGSPANFNLQKVLLRTTILATAVFALYYVNYVYGWIDRRSFDWLLLPKANG